MSENQIGVKLADGSFYPVLEQEFTGRKKLVVTTAQDNQQTVQIHLYRGREGRVEESGYIGSLVLENLAPAPSRQPAIDLELALDAQGNLDAEAHDPQSGQKKSLSVSLTSLEGAPEQIAELPPADKAPGAALETEAIEPSLLTGETYPIGTEDRRREHLERRRVNPLAVLAFVLLGLAILAGAAYLIWRLLDGRPIPALFGGRGAAPVETVQPGEALPEEGPAAAPVKPAAEEPAAEAPAKPAAESTSPGQAERPPAQPPASQQAAAGTEGIWHRIKWGDTLWDLAATYYRNPWLYPRLAKANKIANPDLIIAGRRLFIPKL